MQDIFATVRENCLKIHNFENNAQYYTTRERERESSSGDNYFRVNCRPNYNTAVVPDGVQPSRD